MSEWKNIIRSEFMRNPLGYKTLRTYTQGEQIYELTKKFTANFLDPIKDFRLIAHFNDSARSIPRNIAEGYGRNNTKQYIEFIGFSFGSLLELLEDYLEIEKDIKGGQRKTRDDPTSPRLRGAGDGALGIISSAIKLCMGEKTMLKKQIEKMSQMAGTQGFVSANQRAAKILSESERREKEFDKWLSDIREGRTKL
jgi:four helix bundle protein